MRSLTLYGIPGKMTRRLAGVVIGTQGLAVFFGALVARALASATGSPASGTFLLIGSLLALLCILDAGLLRRPWGITLGWALQLATLACAFIVPAMLAVGLLFGVLWLMALVQGRAMDAHTKRVDAQWHETHGSSGQSGHSAQSEPSTQSEPSAHSVQSEPSTQDG